MFELLPGIEIPHQLHVLAARHKQHLSELITMLRTGGIEEGAIEEAVDQLVSEYRIQLLEAAKALRGIS